jgi:hypothetical protein
MREIIQMKLKNLVITFIAILGLMSYQPGFSVEIRIMSIGDLEAEFQAEKLKGLQEDKEAASLALENVQFMNVQDFNNKQCGGKATDEDLIALFGSKDTFNCDALKKDEDINENYCKCVDTVIVPEDKTKGNRYEKLIEDAFADVLIEDQTEELYFQTNFVGILGYAYPLDSYDQCVWEKIKEDEEGGKYISNQESLSEIYQTELSATTHMDFGEYDPKTVKQNDLKLSNLIYKKSKNGFAEFLKKNPKYNDQKESAYNEYIARNIKDLLSAEEVAGTSFEQIYRLDKFDIPSWDLTKKMLMPISETIHLAAQENADQVSLENLEEGFEIARNHLCYDAVDKFFAFEEKADVLKENPDILKMKLADTINQNNPQLTKELFARINEELKSKDFYFNHGFSAFTNSEEKYAQEIALSSLSVKYQLGRMQCNAKYKSQGASIDVVNEALNNLSNDKIPAVANATSKYLSLQNEIEESIIMSTDSNMALHMKTQELYDYAMAKGIFHPKDSHLYKPDQVIKMLEPHTNNGFVVALIDSYLSLNKSSVHFEKLIKTKTEEAIKVRKNLSKILGDDITNGLLASRTPINFDIYARAKSAIVGSGATRIESVITTQGHIENFQNGNHSKLVLSSTGPKGQHIQTSEQRILSQIKMGSQLETNLREQNQNIPHRDIFAKSDKAYNVNANQSFHENRKQITNSDRIKRNQQNIDAIDEVYQMAFDDLGVKRRSKSELRKDSKLKLNKLLDQKNKIALDDANSKPKQSGQNILKQLKKRTISGKNRSLEKIKRVSTNSNNKDLTPLATGILPSNLPRKVQSSASDFSENQGQARKIRASNNKLKQQAADYLRSRNQYRAQAQTNQNALAVKEKDFNGMIKAFSGLTQSQSELMKTTQDLLAENRELSSELAQVTAEVNELDEQIVTEEIVTSEEIEVVDNFAINNGAAQSNDDNATVNGSEDQPRSNVAAVQNAPRQITRQEAQRLPINRDKSEAPVLPYSNKDEVNLETQNFIELVGTGNEITFKEFEAARSSGKLNDKFDPEKPVLVKTENGHVVMLPLIKDGKVVAFKFIKELSVEEAKDYFVAEQTTLEEESQRLIEYSRLIGLLEKI